jgi:hypothetical protein
MSESTSQSSDTKGVPITEGLSEGLKEDSGTSPGPFPLSARLAETTTPDVTAAATTAINPTTKAI